jgi:dynein heavy chain
VSVLQNIITAEDSAIIDRGTTFIINFSPVLKEIINETKYLEQLGFTIPELARNVALQEDKFLR